MRRGSRLCRGVDGPWRVVLSQAHVRRGVCGERALSVVELLAERLDQRAFFEA